MKSKEYDTDKFCTSACDQKGHSEKLWVRVPPAVSRQIDVVLASGHFPYKTRSDATRHALERHLAWLVTLEPIPSLIGQVEAANEIIRHQQFQQELVDMVANLSRAVDVCVSQGAVGEARRLVSAVKHQIMKMPDGYWRNRCLHELKAKFGHLLGGKGLSLKPSEAISDDEEDSIDGPEGTSGGKNQS